jgi:hypothetical protein
MINIFLRRRNGSDKELKLIKKWVGCGIWVEIMPFMQNCSNDKEIAQKPKKA